METGRFRSATLLGLAACLGVFTALAAAGLPGLGLLSLGMDSQLVIFTGLALIFCFLHFPIAHVFRWSRWAQSLDWVFAAAALYVTVELVRQFESPAPLVRQRVTLVALVLLLEASRRAIGLALPLLVLVFGIYGAFGSVLPEMLLPHRGLSEERLLAQCFLPGRGVFGTALQVTFRDAFPLVAFGVWLVQLGGPAYVLQALDRRFGSRPGGAAQVAVLGGGLLGAIAATPAFHASMVAPFTLPRMRRQGVDKVAAGGTLAAATLGGVLVPPVLSVGAYLMLTLLAPELSLPGLLAASILPGLLYFFSLYLGVRLRSRRDEAENAARQDDTVEVLIRPDLPELRPASAWSGWLLAAALFAFVGPMLAGWPVARAALAATVATLALAFLRRETWPDLAGIALLCRRTAEAALPLVLAAAGAGIVLGVAELTGLGGALQAMVPALAGHGLFLALLAMALLALVVGLALPSAVVYLLLALLLGPALSALGPLPLAIHFFLLCFGLMATITPPVANAATVAAGMAGARLFPTSLYACRLSLAGFALPFLLVYRPQLLMLDPAGGPASCGAVALAAAVAILGTVALAAADSGFFGRPLGAASRVFLLAVAWLILYPGAGSPASVPVTWANLAGVALLAAAAAVLLRRPAASP